MAVPFVLRALTLSIDLRPYASARPRSLAKSISTDLSRQIKRTLKELRGVLARNHVKVRSFRLAVSPIGSLNSSWRSGYLEVARALDELARESGADFVGGFSTFVSTCVSNAQVAFLDSLPECLASTQRVCGFVEVARSDNGMNIDVLKKATVALKAMSSFTGSEETEPAARFCIVCNSAQGTPYMPLGCHSNDHGDMAVYLGIGGVKALNETVSTLPRNAPLDKVMASISRVIQHRTEQGHALAEKLMEELELDACTLDSSLAPLPFGQAHSLLVLLKSIGVPTLNSPGSLTALAVLNDAVKRGSVAAGSKYLSGLSGSFLSISEDSEIYEWLKKNCLSLDRMLALSAVCSVGLDMITLPQSTSDEVLMGIIADEMSLGILHRKTTSVRLILSSQPVGEEVVLRSNPIFGRSFTMPAPEGADLNLIRRGGVVPRHWREYPN